MILNVIFESNTKIHVTGAFQSVSISCQVFNKPYQYFNKVPTNTYSPSRYSYVRCSEVFSMLANIKSSDLWNLSVELATKLRLQ